MRPLRPPRSSSRTRRARGRTAWPARPLRWSVSLPPPSHPPGPVSGAGILHAVRRRFLAAAARVTGNSAVSRLDPASRAGTRLAMKVRAMETIETREFMDEVVPVKPGGTLYVKSTRGAIDVRSHDQDEVRIEAE